MTIKLNSVFVRTMWVFAQTVTNKSLKFEKGVGIAIKSKKTSSKLAILLWNCWLPTLQAALAKYYRILLFICGEKVSLLNISTFIPWKTFAVNSFHSIHLYNTLFKTKKFTKKVSRLPSNLQKMWNFFTTIKKQYTVFVPVHANTIPAR